MANCELLVKNGLNTNETCHIYYEYLQVVKKIKETENELQVLQEERRKRMLEEKERVNSIKEQNDAILLLQHIANDEVMKKIFLDMYDIYRPSFNEKYEYLDDKYLRLANFLYDMDYDSRDTLFVENGIY